MPVRDGRVERYAELLLGTCLGVERGWQVMVWGTPWARPLLEEVMKQLAERGAYPLLRLTFSGGHWREHRAWLRHAPLDVISEPAMIEVHARHQCDAWLGVQAPENTRDGADIPAERTRALENAYGKAYRDVRSRPDYVDTPAVMCWFPTSALAQDAGMSLAQFADFLYGACLLDWEAEGKRMQRYAERFDAAEEVHIVADGTDLRLSIAGRSALVDAGSANMPGGEFFLSPVEDSAHGEIAFSEYPAVYLGREVSGVRLRFENGVVVDASASANEEFLIEQLDRDEGARRLGELGIGCNPGITRHMKNTLFDEKMDGTVHLALGNGLPDVGGTNESQVHWDIVKEMRREGTRIELDGETVQEGGRWLL